ncbi:MAG TPA: long-chain-fatty-acid--CoA ligase [Acidimicrobiales bacterium]|nr:long-chain-fatty-acid--CoA ligase [Acidimicrobiales bacterium]
MTTTPAERASSLAAILDHWAETTPDGPALTMDEVTVRWRELAERSRGVAAALQGAGVEPGDRVGFYDKNSLEYFEVLFGAAMLNAVTVAVNWRLAPDEIVAVADDAGLRVLVVAAEFADVARRLEAEVPSLEKVVVIEEEYASWRDAGGPVERREASPDDVAMLLYTSGTTGEPKGVMIDNRNLGALLARSDELGFTLDGAAIVGMPLFHMGGVGWALWSLYQGSHSVVMREFDPRRLLELIAEHRVTHVLLVPAMLLVVTGTPEAATADLSTVRVMVYGAAPISEELLEVSLKLFDCDFYQVYGATETTGAVTWLRPEDHRADGAAPPRLRSAGRAMTAVELRVVDTDSELPVGADQIGEVWIRSAQVMKGYWNKPDATAATVTDDGWYRTGDAGSLDAEGYLYLYDRVKDMIVTGAENVYPIEVENVLMRHPAVADVAVIGVPSERWGEEVKAVVVRHPGEQVTAEELIAFTRERLAGYKTPKSVDFLDVLPRNPSGKILKKDLRAPYWAGRSRLIG